MDTKIRFLEVLGEDLRQAADREVASQTTLPKRRRRFGEHWRGVAAAAVVLLVVAGIIGQLAGGGGQYATGPAGSFSQPGRVAVGVPKAPTDQNALAPGHRAGLAAGSADQTTSFGVSSPAAAPSTTQAPSVQSGPQPDLSKIERDGTISLQVAKGGFQDAFNRATGVAVRFHGFVFASTTSQGTSGTLTLRIPSKHFDAAMVALSGIGKVLTQSSAARDVTAEFIDLKARLQVLRADREVLLGFLKKATSVSQTLSLRRQLDNVQLQIEQTTGQLNVINNQVAESTIKVAIREQGAPSPEQKIKPVTNPSLGRAWDHAVAGFLGVVSAVLVGLGYLIPIGVLLLLGWLIYTLTRRRRTAG